MVWLDLSTWLSDWSCHFVLAFISGLLAFWLTLITLWILFRSVGFRHRSCAFWQLLAVVLGTLITSLAAGLFCAFALHYLQDYWFGPLWHIEYVWRIL